MKYLMDRLSEPSTWRGITLVLTGIGVKIAPDMMEGIVTVGMVVAGTVGAVMGDRSPSGSK